MLFFKKRCYIIRKQEIKVNRNMPPKIELLAPAGNPAAALAAFDAGADAVYCGLRKFNARERSENFTTAELAKTIAYAHRNSRRVYVTFNTLLREAELPEAAAELAKLAFCAPDAVIVQDPGVLRILREYFPDLPVHASTQMGFHNSAGLEVAASLGIRRVILERQVTLEEIRAMRSASKGKLPVELEVFVHGALCCCLSGSCLFSSWLGGWSGNRGKCKQPCRRQYFREEDVRRSRGEFLFSPDDLSTLELLDSFREAGVVSFKIEGRLRRADYVEKVVRAYRTVLDAVPEQRSDALHEASDILRGVCARKPSLGFYTDASAKNLVRLGPYGGSGVPCGTVNASVPGGLEAVMSARLHVGDTIRVQGAADSDDGFTLTVLHLEVNNRPVMKALSGERCFIRCDQKASRNALIYRTGESGPDYSARLAKLPLPKPALDLAVSLNGTRLAVRVLNVEKPFEWEVRPPLQPAQKRPLSAENLRAEFASAASDIFEAGHIEAEVEGDWFLPASELKKLRRDFWSRAEAEIPPEAARAKVLAALSRFRKEYAGLRPWEGAALPDCIALGKDGIRSCCVARELDEVRDASDEVILPPFVPETELAALREKIEVRLASGSRVFRITSLFQLAFFRGKSGVTLKTSFPLPVCNSSAVQLCRELGIAGAQAWIEMGRLDWIALREKTVLPLELYAYGRPCVFTTRASLLGWQGISDQRDHAFHLEKEDSLTHLYPDGVLKIEEIPPGFSRFTDLRHASENETELSRFNELRGWA